MLFLNLNCSRVSLLPLRRGINITCRPMIKKCPRRFMLLASIVLLFGPEMKGQFSDQIGSGAVVFTSMQKRVNDAHQQWADQNRTLGLRSVLTYGNGVPLLELTLTVDGPAEQVHRTNAAIVSALDFILADDAFSQMRLSIVEIDMKRRPHFSKKEYEVNRSRFLQASLSTARVGSLSDAVKRTRVDNKLAASLCADLGIKIR